MQDGKIVAFVLGCVDFRHHTQEARTIEKLKTELGADEIYFCTTAGPDGKMLDKGNSYLSIIEDGCIIRDAKNASVFAVLGHYDCAGHSVSDEQHDCDTLKAAQLLSDGVQSETVALVFVPTKSGEGLEWNIKRLGVKSPSKDTVAAA